MGDLLRLEEVTEELAQHQVLQAQLELNLEEVVVGAIEVVGSLRLSRLVMELMVGSSSPMMIASLQPSTMLPAAALIAWVVMVWQLAWMVLKMVLLINCTGMEILLVLRLTEQEVP
ncbi:hypothetical protein SDC9_28974 [bioreactor metagenome]|uniref:Uncharacterized protein n=1 Tax=bioreactor metagenome TaxID=1076179 RepID=A0A644UVU7_9ZZZZ